MIDKKRLRDSFSAYLRGEPPSGIEMAKAPRISDWKAVIVKSVDTGAHEMRLRGTVSGHPGIHDGPAQTSPVLWIDKERRLARTMSRLYILDEPAVEPAVS